MRRFHLATLITLISLVSGGCRQTTGPTTAGPLTPIGPASTLSPVGAGQVPVLGPFGGPTRVTPPATGSYVAPNNYMGGVAPTGQAPGGVSAAGGFAPANNVIGSGVQVAGWTETNSVAGQTAPNPQSTPGAGAFDSRDPRSGGMQIIDLTGAPVPPGYRTSPPTFPNATTQPNWQQGVTPPTQNPNFQNPNFQNPNFQNPNFQNPNFQNPSFQNPNLQNPNLQNPSFRSPDVRNSGVQTIRIPSPAQIANAGQTVGSSGREVPIGLAPIGSGIPRTASAPLQSPSTDPIRSDNGDGSQPNLPWRRPGTSF